MNSHNERCETWETLVRERFFYPPVRVDRHHFFSFKVT